MKHDLSKSAAEATELLKAMAHDGRLQILCLLLGREKSAGEIQCTLSLGQASASQQLARLRLSGLVKARREGRKIYYRISDQRVLSIVKFLYDLFCAEKIEE